VMVVSALFGGLACTGCGSSAQPTTTVSHAQRTNRPTGNNVAAVEKSVSTLYAALSRSDYAAACDQYTPNIQAAVILAARQLAARHLIPAAPATCSAALKAQLGALGQRQTRLGSLHFQSVSLSGNTATVEFSYRVESSGLLAHSTALVMHEFGKWKVDRATALTFSG
jgi:hypothetical protein